MAASTVLVLRELGVDLSTSIRAAAEVYDHPARGGKVRLPIHVVLAGKQYAGNERENRPDVGRSRASAG